MSIDIQYVRNLIQPHLRDLKPYASARDDFDSSASTNTGWVFLDANENPNPTDYNRYPDPHQRKLKQVISQLTGVPEHSIFLGNGSDEAIDLLIRMFCRTGVHHVIIPVPTYGMYSVSASINGIAVKSASLTENYDLDVSATMKLVDEHTRLIFLCSPNNPTGNLLSRSSIMRIVDAFPGIVIIDEAYIDFSQSESMTSLIAQRPNVVVLQTLSKAWGLAGLRIGMAFAHQEIITALNRIKPPYNISGPAQEMAIDKLNNPGTKDSEVKSILVERQRLTEALGQLRIVKTIFPSNANFVLVKVSDAIDTYNKLVEKHIIVRNRHGIVLCDQCLRITIGTRRENDQLVKALSEI